jgi:uncharacterized protein YceK
MNLPRLVLLVLVSLTLSGCAVVTVAGAAAGAAITVGAAVVSTGVKATGAVIGAVAGDDKDDD